MTATKAEASFGVSDPKGMNLPPLTAGVCAAILSLPLSFAQSTPLPQDAEIVILPTGDKLLYWLGHAGRTYFIETTDPNFPLGVWAWAPIIELGNDGFISYEIEGTADKAFFRLHHTDLPLPAGVTPEDWDADSDGLSSWSEITTHGTDPLNLDTSGDGIPDGWAVAHGLAPLINNASGLFQGSQSTNLQAYDAGVQADPNANLTNLDGDRANNEEDADPHDPVIDWAPGPKPFFAVIELDIEDVENVTLDDFTRNGTLLFTHNFGNYPETDDYPYERIVVDRNQAVHTFAAADWGTGGVGFWAYGTTLIGEKVLGTKIVNGVSQESVWDPLSNIYIPYQNPAPYHDNIRDDQNGVTIWNGPDQTGAAWGLRKSPGEQLLPGAAALAEGGIGGRIEEHGNIISNASYWRWNTQSESFDQPVSLPEQSNLRSATLTQVQKNGAPDREWNLVAGAEGLMVSCDRNPFQKARGATGSEAVHGVTRQGWVIDHYTGKIWTNGEWHFLKEYLGSPSFEEAELLDILDTGLAVAKIRRTSSDPLRIALLLPVEIVAHERGTIDSPGKELTNKKNGEYGYETVMMENADAENNTTGKRDCDTNKDLAVGAATNKDKDDDLVKIVLHYPGLKIEGASLELKHEGIAVDATKEKPEDAIETLTTGSRITFYDKDGKKLNPATDLKIADLKNPGTGYLAKILDPANDGKLTLFIEGADEFGLVGPSLGPVKWNHSAGNVSKAKSAAKKLGGIRLKLVFEKEIQKVEVPLLVYRGGFLVFRQPKDDPGVAGSFEFWDGKGRIRHEYGGHGNEFKKDNTDWGTKLKTWSAKSGKTYGKDYNKSEELGHIPPGWWINYERTILTGGQKNKTRGSGNSKRINQGAYCRWQQDDADANGRYTKSFEYKASISRDKTIGEPKSVSYKFEMLPLPPSSGQTRSDIQIHPDGKKDGTAGCIGLQNYIGCLQARYVLRNYHNLTIRVETE